MDQQVAPIPVYRPPFLTDGGEFRGSLVESPANIFYQKVKASRATLNRMQFQWRSVSDNLLLSPTVMLRFKLKVTCRQLWTQLTSYISVHGLSSHVDAGGADAAIYEDAQNAGNAGNAAGLRVPCLTFADGDAFASVCSSMNLVFNGTSVSLNRCNRFWRDYVRTQVACEDVARIYKSSGGSYDKFDQTPVCVGTGNLNAISCGITQDSGISERSKNLYAQSYNGKVETDDHFSRYIQVSYPVPIPPFNPWRGYALPASCPYTKCPYAIPHLSAGGLDFLMEDFEKGFIRRLGGVRAGGNPNSLVSANSNTSAVTFAIDEDSVHIELKYFRLSHTRALKESYRFNIWQAQTFLGPAPPTQAGNGFVLIGTGQTDAMVALAPTGKDHVTGEQRTISTISSTPVTWSIEFDTINLAQIPSYLLISVPKLGQSYSQEATSGAYGNDALNSAMRNLSRNLNIKQIRIIVNSARGAIEKSEDVTTGFMDAERLWEMTKENCNSKYFVDGGFRAWRDHQCAILLSSPQFAPGLQACDGVAYPVQIQIEMVCENRSVDVSALASLLPGENTVGQAHFGHKQVVRLAADFIRAQAQCTAFYQKVILATTETAATVNSMNYPLASAERLMNSAGRMR